MSEEVTQRACPLEMQKNRRMRFRAYFSDDRSPSRLPRVLSGGLAAVLVLETRERRRRLKCEPNR